MHINRLYEDLSQINGRIDVILVRQATYIIDSFYLQQMLTSIGHRRVQQLICKNQHNMIKRRHLLDSYPENNRCFVDRKYFYSHTDARFDAFTRDIQTLSNNRHHFQPIRFVLSDPKLNKSN